MRVWRSELYADIALTMPCVTIYVKAFDFVDAVDTIAFSAMNFAIICYPALPVEVDSSAISFPDAERIGSYRSASPKFNSCSSFTERARAYSPRRDSRASRCRRRNWQHRNVSAALP